MRELKIPLLTHPWILLTLKINKVNNKYSKNKVINFSPKILLIFVNFWQRARKKISYQQKYFYNSVFITPNYRKPRKTFLLFQHSLAQRHKSFSKYFFSLLNSRSLCWLYNFKRTTIITTNKWSMVLFPLFSIFFLLCV